MNQYDRVRATFTPKRTDNLRPEAAAGVGAEGVFYAACVIDDGHDYAGQWAMLPTLETTREWDLKGLFLGWIPFEDLTVLEELGGYLRPEEPPPVETGAKDG